MEPKRLAITLTNGRSHVLDLPETVAAADAATVIYGEQRGSEIGWEAGDAEWLSYDDGFGRARRSAIIEVSIVDYPTIEEA